MAKLGPSIDELISALRCLPGVGPKSAQRMTFHLLERNRDGAQRLVQALSHALDNVKHCQRCRILSETELCSRCNDDRRQQDILCIVEMPSDVLAIEQATQYQGQYFVLSGHLSPLDGIGPDALGIPKLIEWLDKNTIEEVILATNPTIEGEATAHFIGELARTRNIKVSRLAHGIPLGGELEFIDSSTLSHAFSGRESL
ncbi:MAG TPA: recombination protein RecR [Methylophaga aminisulfidivorans]|jgi:recombination protein RecR|uniref:Recombination protein RecR n=2 Tax=Methylophaga TaxID=40222 RepID=F5SVL6_9GAMM|nr:MULTISPECIES: recombination mediator RecR [Methylophaga]EGL55926.1 recombinational DNA repair protein [Methylophaga aminisulfidivorans MP]WVI86224.1 recombination mediator RecR [Methylophaga thalassica]GLP98394.1 recombination protein RecR [Methylophaga thalassica]HIC46034.1 recombination protein RecR [Methylophaga sp.]HIM40773.1 recombination protein RecR [Methylophaga aminisulfidivorans]